MHAALSIQWGAAPWDGIVSHDELAQLQPAFLELADDEGDGAWGIASLSCSAVIHD